MMLKQEKTQGIPSIIPAFELGSGLKSLRVDKEGNADQFQQSAVQVGKSAEQVEQSVVQAEKSAEEVEQSAERTTTIRTWMKANPIEVFVMSTLLVAAIFSLITFAANKKGYWGGVYVEGFDEVVQTLTFTFGYSSYTYHYEYFIDSEGIDCKRTVSYTDKYVDDIPLGEITYGMQAMQSSSAVLALLIIAFRMMAFGDYLPGVVDKIVLHYFTVGASIICVAGLLVFFILMPLEIVHWLKRNNDSGCLDFKSNVVFSDWASCITIIVIGIWISTIIILLIYPFWGTQDEDESLLLLIEQSKKTLGGTVHTSMNHSTNGTLGPLGPPGPLHASPPTSPVRSY